MAENGTLVTRNPRGFSAIAGLDAEGWTI